MSEIALLVVSSGAVISSLVLLTKKIQRCTCCKGLCSCDQDTVRADAGSPEQAIEHSINQLHELQQAQKPQGPKGIMPVAYMPESRPRKFRRNSSHI